MKISPFCLSTFYTSLRIFLILYQPKILLNFMYINAKIHYEVCNYDRYNKIKNGIC